MALSDIIISAFEFENTTGAFVDSIDSNNATNYGITRGITGIQGNGISMGSGDYAEAAYNANFDITDYISVEAFVKTNGTGSYQTIICHPVNNTSHSSPYHRWALIVNNNGYADFFVGLYGSREAIGTTDLTDGNWHHIIGTFNDTTRTLRVYVDGVLEDENTGTSGMSTGNTVMRIGENGGFGEQFVGELDEIRIYNGELTSTEVSDLYNSGAGRPLSYITGSSSTLNLNSDLSFNLDLSISSEELNVIIDSSLIFDASLSVNSVIKSILSVYLSNVYNLSADTNLFYSLSSDLTLDYTLLANIESTAFLELSSDLTSDFNISSISVLNVISSSSLTFDITQISDILMILRVGSNLTLSSTLISNINVLSIISTDLSLDLIFTSSAIAGQFLIANFSTDFNLSTNVYSKIISSSFLDLDFILLSSITSSGGNEIATNMFMNFSLYEKSNEFGLYNGELDFFIRQRNNVMTDVFIKFIDKLTYNSYQ